MDDFGPYAVIARVAVGSTATVYKTRHREIDRVAAVKDLNPALRALPGFLEQFRAEARVLGSLVDEHIVAVYDFVEEPTRSWIAEEWIDGATIDAVLAASGSLTAEQSLGVLRGALLGLAHAHDEGVVHGDLAPANIIADLQGTSKLIDFGVSAPIGTTGVRGTPAFMSPEAVMGSPVGKSSDVYSAGAILFTLLAGHPPFDDATLDAILKAHVERPAPPLLGHGDAMSSLVADSLAKDAASRPADARQFLERMEDAAREKYGAAWLSRASIAGVVAAAGGTAALSAVTAGGGVAPVASAGTTYVGAAATTGEVARKTRRVSRGQLIAGGAVAAVALAGAGLAFALSGNSGSPRASATEAAASVASAAPATPSSATPTLSALEALPTAGKYRITGRITSTTFPQDKVGPLSASTWTLSLTCASSRCTGSVHSSSGRVYAGAFDGSSLTLTFSRPDNGNCVYDSGPKKGKVVPHSYARSTITGRLQFTVVRRSPGPTPTAGTALLLSGTGLFTEPRAVVSSGCRNTTKPRRETVAYTLTYLAG